jgi:hypothetical protein
MVSKCANPECSERFLYLHQGRIFHLTPTPELEAAADNSSPALYERFWLCDHCCRKITLVWGGTEVKLVPLPPEKIASQSAGPEHVHFRRRSRKRAASAGPQRA